MITIPISVKFVGLKEIIKSLTRIAKTAIKQESALPKICALDYVQLVKQKIMGQEFNYPALSEEYAEWKSTYFPSAKTFWHLSGDLLKAIQAINLGENTWAGTIPESAIDSGGKNWSRTGGAKSILFYAIALENGVPSMNIKARPLFGPTAQEYLLEGFMKRIQPVMDKFVSDWR